MENENALLLVSNNQEKGKKPADDEGAKRGASDGSHEIQDYIMQDKS